MKDQYFPDGIPTKKIRNQMLKNAKEKMEILQKKINYACNTRNSTLANFYTKELFHLTKAIYILQCYNLKKGYREGMLNAMESGIKKADETIDYTFFTVFSIIIISLLIIIYVQNSI